MSEQPPGSDKVFISPEQLMRDSLALGRMIIESDFRPNYICGVWRGGTPVGIAVQELLDFYGIETDHISIRTSSYSGIGRQKGSVRVHGLAYLTNSLDADDRLLIVDDVFDTGLSVQAIIEKIHHRCRRNTPSDLRVATAYFKPSKNRTDFKPDFHVHETDDWLIFPHEMEGLTQAEIRQHKPLLAEVIDELQQVASPVRMAD